MQLIPTECTSLAAHMNKQLLVRADMQANMHSVHLSGGLHALLLTKDPNFEALLNQQRPPWWPRRPLVIRILCQGPVHTPHQLLSVSVTVGYTTNCYHVLLVIRQGLNLPEAVRALSSRVAGS